MDCVQRLWLVIESGRESVDHIRATLEGPGHLRESIVKEEIGLDVEGGRDGRDDLAVRNRPIPVHKVVQISRRQTRELRELSIRNF
jgi:hypothetical protein